MLGTATQDRDGRVYIEDSHDRAPLHIPSNKNALPGKMSVTDKWVSARADDDKKEIDENVEWCRKRLAVLEKHASILHRRLGHTVCLSSLEGLICDEKMLYTSYLIFDCKPRAKGKYNHRLFGLFTKSKLLTGCMWSQRAGFSGGPLKTNCISLLLLRN